MEVLEERVRSWPESFQVHLELVEALREAGEAKRLREARTRMQAVFPLTQGNVFLSYNRLSKRRF